jgi:hypothetical protein
MKFFYFVLVSLLFLTGCSQTRLHIVNQGYSTEYISVLAEKLSKLDVVIVESRVSIPDTFSDSTVATNPYFINIELLESIEAILQLSDIDSPEYLTFAQGKHFYSRNHVGLYLRNKNNIKPIMPAYLRTQYCEFADATIMFSNDGRFALEFERSAYEEKLVVIKGNYSFDNKYLQLVTEHGVSQSYILNKEIKHTQLGERPADVFKPKSMHSGLELLNCEFLIIYME